MFSCERVPSAPVFANPEGGGLAKLTRLWKEMLQLSSASPGQHRIQLREQAWLKRQQPNVVHGP